jgi:hypothetical protein
MPCTTHVIERELTSPEIMAPAATGAIMDTTLYPIRAVPVMVPVQKYIYM